MVPEKFIVDGKDIKQLPLRVVAYIGDSEEYYRRYLESIISEIKNYVETETSWKLFIGFKDSGLCVNGWVCENDTIGLNYCSDEYRAFDLVIIPDCSNYNPRMLLNLVCDENNITMPLFILSSETVITDRADEIVDELNEKCIMREEGYYA